MVSYYMHLLCLYFSDYVYGSNRNGSCSQTRTALQAQYLICEFNHHREHNEGKHSGALTCIRSCNG